MTVRRVNWEKENGKAFHRSELFEYEGPGAGSKIAFSFGGSLGSRIEIVDLADGRPIKMEFLDLVRFIGHRLKDLEIERLKKEDGLELSVGL